MSELARYGTRPIPMMSMHKDGNILECFDWLVNRDPGMSSPNMGFGFETSSWSHPHFRPLSPCLPLSVRLSYLPTFSPFNFPLNILFPVRRAVSQSLSRPLSRQRPLDARYARDFRRLLSASPTTPVSIPWSHVQLRPLNSSWL